MPTFLGSELLRSESAWLAKAQAHTAEALPTPQVLLNTFTRGASEQVLLHHMLAHDGCFHCSHDL